MALRLSRVVTAQAFVASLMRMAFRARSPQVQGPMALSSIPAGGSLFGTG